MRGPRRATVSPDGRNVFVSSFLEDGVLTFSRNTSTGALTIIEELADDSWVVGNRSQDMSDLDLANVQAQSKNAIWMIILATGRMPLISCN